MTKVYSSFVEATGTYQDAIRLLSSRRRPVRPASLAKQLPDLAPNQYKTPNLRGTPSIRGMQKWLQVLGHSDADLKALNVIHVAGTKGKGSTCALTEILLRTHGKRAGFPKKTGLYTSPHLVQPLERIRINFSPLSKELFTKYFFEVYTALSQSTDIDDFDKTPRYLQLWAIVAFHAFIREQVDVAIIETHHGGEFDATNFVKEPVVTVVTSLGMDHVDQLGPKLTNVAWHKAGIFKPGAAAIVAPQAPEAAAVLRERAVEKGVELEVVDSYDSTQVSAAQLPSDVLRLNCSLAASAANALLQHVKPEQRLSDTDIAQGIADFTWPGRFQQIQDGRCRWYLDAAHNELSMEKAAQWFAEAATRASKPSSDVHNVLLFSHISNNRDGGKVLKSLLKSLKNSNVPFDKVIFTTYIRTTHGDREIDLRDGQNVEGLWRTYSDIWSEHYPNAAIHIQSTIDDAVRFVQQISSEHVQILATGSQHLLGGILEQLTPDDR